MGYGHDGMSATPEQFDLLVLGAHVPDLQGLRRHLGPELAGTLGRFRVLGKAVGMGMGSAGAAAMRRIQQVEPRGVLFLGTCGVYPELPDYQPHDVVVASGLKLLDHAALAHESAYPEPMSTQAPVHPLLSAGLANVRPRTRQVPVASPLAHTVSDRLARAVPEHLGCHVENLEAFAVGQACHLARVPFAAVLGVTHIVGARGFDDWKRFVRVSTTVAADVIATWVHNGAQGLPHP
jgi:nucleoside phosphorylase